MKMKKRTNYYLEAESYTGKANEIKDTLDDTKTGMNEVDEILSEKQYKSSKDFVTSNLVSRNDALKSDVDKIIQKLNSINNEVTTCANVIDRRNEQINNWQEEQDQQSLKEEKEE